MKKQQKYLVSNEMEKLERWKNLAVNEAIYLMEKKQQEIKDKKIEEVIDFFSKATIGFVIGVTFALIMCFLLFPIK